MLIIKSIEVIETDRDMFELQVMTDNFAPIEYGAQNAVEASITREMIKGKRFRDSCNNRDILIGWSKEAQDVLQLPFDAFNDMNIAIEELSAEVGSYRDMMNEADSYIKQLESMSLIEHIKLWWKHR